MPDPSSEAAPSHALPPAIQWVPLGTLTVYHITEQELDQLEKGTPESTYFGFAVFLLSAGISFLISLATTEIKSVWLFNIFLVVSLVGLVAGVLLLVIWIRFQRSTAGITKSIRSRKPPEGQKQT